MKQKDTLMTVKEVCQVLKISRRTLYRLLEQGRLPGFKVGHEWRFRYGEVDKYLESKPVLQPRYFNLAVLEKYRRAPDKYEITEDKQGGWVGLTEAYQAVCPATASFARIRFIYFTGKAGIKLLGVMPRSFNDLPLAEVRYWLRFEFK